MAIARLVTHSGTFHADDVCAYAILADLYPEAALERTRDPARIAHDPEGSVVFDVGGVYDPDQRRFDHHQADAPTRPDGLAYASFGLVWEHLGREWLSTRQGLPSDLVDAVHQGMAAGMVRAVDQVDVQAVPPGVHVPSTLSGLVFAMNPQDGWTGQDRVSEEDRTSAFLDAAGFVRGALQREVRQQAREAVAGLVLEDAIARSDDPRVAVLNAPVPWQRSAAMAADAQDLLVVVAPGTDPTEWCISAVPKEADGFARRRLFPKAWRGLAGQELVDAGGPAGIHFCHKDGYFAATRDKGAALAFARHAIMAWDKEDKRNRLVVRAQEMVGASAGGAPNRHATAMQAESR